jgi:hypothetical protein
MTHRREPKDSETAKKRLKTDWNKFVRKEEQSSGEESDSDGPLPRSQREMSQRSR